MSALSEIYDFSTMYNGDYIVVGVTSNSLILKPKFEINEVVYPKYRGGANVTPRELPDIQIEISTQYPRVRTIPLGIKFIDNDIQVAITVNGVVSDISSKVTCEGSVDYEHEGIYKLIYHIDYLGYRVDYPKIINVSRVEWLKYLVPEVFRSEGKITKELINRLEQMYWSFSNQLDESRFILSDSKIACSSFEEHPYLAGKIYPTNSNYLFTDLDLNSNQQFLIESGQESRICINQIIAKEFDITKSYEIGDVTKYSSKTYLRITDNDEKYPDVSPDWIEGYLISCIDNDAVIEEVGDSPKTIFRDNFKIEYAGYIYQFNSEKFASGENPFNLLDIQKNNYKYLTPPRCIGLWTPSVEETSIENDLVVALDNHLQPHYLIRNDSKYVRQVVPPYDNDNELWYESQIWVLCEDYHGQYALAKRVNNLTSFEIENYALELGIPEPLMQLIHKYNQNDISILYAIQFLAKYRHTIPGFLFLIRLLGLKVSKLQKSKAEESIYIYQDLVSSIEEQLNALSDIDLSKSKGQYDPNKTYEEGDIYFDDDHIYKIRNGNAVEVWRYEWNPLLVDRNNAYYEAEISTENLASDNCYKVITNIGETEPTYYIEDDGVKVDIINSISNIEKFSVPAYVIVNAILKFYSEIKSQRWSIAHATYHFDSYAGLPPYHIMFDSERVAKLEGSVYNPDLVFKNASFVILRNGDEQYPHPVELRTPMKMNLDLLGNSLLDVRVDTPPGFILAGWKIQGMGDIIDEHGMSIDNTKRNPLSGEVVNGDLILTALLLEQFELDFYGLVDDDPEDWTKKIGTYEVYDDSSLAALLEKIDEVRLYYGEDDYEVAADLTITEDACLFKSTNIESLYFIIVCDEDGGALFKFRPASVLNPTHYENNQMKFDLSENQPDNTRYLVDSQGNRMIDSNGNYIVVEVQ